MLTRSQKTSAMLVLAFWTALSVVSAAEVAKTLEIGEPAPDFSLPGVDGKQYSLKGFSEANVLVVIFTCNHCPTAQAYEDRIQELAKEYRDKSVAVVAISPNDPLAVRLDELGYTDVGDSLDDMKIRAKNQGFQFPYLYDGENQKVSLAYGAMATPHVFVFDRDRRLRYTGRIDDSAKPDQVTTHDTRAALDALLSGKPVPVEKTRTFGCSIKWSDKRDSVRQSLERWNQEAVTLEEIDRQRVAELVANNSNKLRLINVWALWCGPCCEEFSELITICADVPERKDAAVKFLNENHASCRNFQFRGKNEYELAEALDPKWQGALPYTLVVAPGGKILYRKQDEFDPLEVRKAIVEHLGRVYK